MKRIWVKMPTTFSSNLNSILSGTNDVIDVFNNKSMGRDTSHLSVSFVFLILLSFCFYDFRRAWSLALTCSFSEYIFGKGFSGIERNKHPFPDFRISRKISIFLVARLSSPFLLFIY